MSEQTWKNHPSNPAAQPFNINGSRNKTKTKSWWNVASPTYFRSKGSKKTKNAFTQDEE